MNYKFDYDFKKDFPKQSKWAVIENYIIGIAMLIIGCTVIFSENDYSNFFRIGYGVFIALASLIFIIIGLNKNRPLIKEGVQYVKIKDENIQWRFGLLRKPVRLSFDEIRLMKLSEYEIYIETVEKIEHRLPIRKLVSEDKKKELLELLKDLNLNNNKHYSEK